MCLISAALVETTGLTPVGGVNPTYLLTAPTYGAITGGTISNENEDDPNPAAHHSSGFSPPPTSLREHNGNADPPKTYNGGGDNIYDNDDYYNLREATLIPYEASNTHVDT